MIQYESNTLVTVVFRVDFAASIRVDDESLRQKCISLCPFSQSETVTEQTINTIMDEKGEVTIERQKESYISMTYSNRQLNQKIVISPKCVVIELLDYSSYPETKGLFMSVFSLVRQLNPKVSISRIGMRYINQIDLSSMGKTTREKHIRSALMESPLDRVVKEAALSRTKHLMEILVDDYRVRCITGYFNPDYPAPIKRHIVTLDYDAFIQGNADANEVDGYLDRFHSTIQMLFENSILQRQKERMSPNGK